MKDLCSCLNFIAPNSSAGAARPHRRNRIIAVGISALCALLILVGCNETKSAPTPKDPGVEGVEKTVEKGAVKLTVRVTPKKPRLSDTILLELTVRADPDVEIKKPEFGKGVHEFTIRDYDVLPEKLEEGKMVRRFRYKLEAEQGGKLLIRSQQIEYVDKREQEKNPGKRSFILSAPLELFVSTDTEGKAPDLKDLAQMAEPVALDPRPFPAWAIALGVAGLIYWFEHSMPAFHEVVHPLYWIIATIIVFGTWRWVRTRSKPRHDRRDSDRRHADRRNDTPDRPMDPPAA